MRFFRSVFRLLLVLSGIGISQINACPSCGGPAASIGTRPSHYLGSTDKKGRLQIWFDLGAFRFSEKVSLPIKLTYTSAPEVRSATFGQGWFCPAFESRAYLESERKLIVHLLGGRTQNLYRDAKSGNFVSPNTHWIARDVGGGRLVVLGPGKTEFTYQNGILQSAKFTDCIVNWVYDGPRVTRIETSDGNRAIVVHYQPGAGLPDRLIIDGKSFELEFGDLPLFREVQGLPAISSLQPSLKAISSPGQRLEIEKTADRSGVFTAIVKDQKKGTSGKYIWNGVSGALLSDDEWQYSVKPSEEKSTTDRFVVSRINAGGKTESFEATPNFTRHVRPDGSIMKRYFTRVPGPAYGEPRKFELSKNGKITNAWKWNYDEQGALIRKISGQVVEMWRRNDAGDVVEYSKAIGEKTLERLVYNDEGQLVTRQSGKNLFQYAYDSGAMVASRHLDGKYIGSFAKLNGDASGRTALIPFVDNKESLIPFASDARQLSEQSLATIDALRRKLESAKETALPKKIIEGN